MGERTGKSMMQGGLDKEIVTAVPFPQGGIGAEMAPAAGSQERIFERVSAQLKARLGSEVYSSWFGRMKVAEASKHHIRLSVPTAFLRSWINGHYHELITELWKEEDPDVLKVEIIVRSATRQARVLESRVT